MTYLCPPKGSVAAILFLLVLIQQYHFLLTVYIFNNVKYCVRRALQKNIVLLHHFNKNLFNIVKSFYFVCKHSFLIPILLSQHAMIPMYNAPILHL